MAVYKRRYRPYHGPLTPERSRFLVLTRYAFAGLFRSRVFVLLFVLALVPTLFFAAYIFLANNSAVQPLDRKSTRLNSSHGYISYAVFCLKKKKKKNISKTIFSV